MKDKWYFENDADRKYEESNPLSGLDFFIHGPDKMLGKGVRDGSRSCTVRHINHGVSIAMSVQTKETVEGCDTYWYHHRIFGKSENNSIFYKMHNLLTHSKEVPTEFIHSYYYKRSK